ncbi:hypothetical protein NF867_06995 [Solitalea sp. MAHUQ-68]|uniref:DUF4382 domain-containing protein n=1 Tax=Solitalea agri TaxID=2953739 RepID=A0A9X2JEP5_9SPHI|nr:hypothetical protein [Solitalea agri]MCO4292601.1 hypothetical protein [Solitalea agri]
MKSTLNSSIGLSLLIISLTAISCKKEDSAATFHYQIKTTSAPAVTTASGVSTESTPASIKWNEGYINVSEVVFEAEKDEPDGQNNDVDKVDFEYNDLVKVDPFATSGNTFGNVSIVPGAYENIEIQVKVKNSHSVPPIVLKGTYTSTGVTTPVELFINEDLDINADYGDFSVGENRDYLGLITLRLDLLSAGITLEELNAASKVDGKVVISQTSNAAIYQKIKANIEAITDVQFEN